MADNFKYVINAELKLKTGSLNQVLKDIKDVDTAIKGHFEKAEGGVRVPVTVDKDISKFQSQVKKVVDGYNKGQAPSIKIPVAIDESSISKLQQRIAEVRRQLNSLSDEKNKININTSLVVGESEKNSIQNQVKDVTPTVEVKLIANQDDLKAIQAQIEGIRAEVTASIGAIQSPENLRTFGRADRNSPAPRSIGSIKHAVSKTINNNKADKFLNGRQEIQGEIKSIKEMQKMYEEEFKAIDDLEKYKNTLNSRISNIEKNKSQNKSKVRVNDDYSNGITYTKSTDYDGAVASYKKQIEQIDQMLILKKQLVDKEKQLNVFEGSYGYDGTSKAGPHSVIPDTHPLGQLSNQLKAKTTQEKQKQEELKKSQDELKKEQDKSDKLADDIHNAMSVQQAKTLRKNRQNVEKSIADSKKSEAKWMDQASSGYRVHQAKEYALPKVMHQRKVSSAMNSAENYNRKVEYQRYLDSMPTLDEKRNSIIGQMNTTKMQLSTVRSSVDNASVRNNMSPKDKQVALGNISKLELRIQSLEREAKNLEEEINKLTLSDKDGRKLKDSLRTGNTKINPTDSFRDVVKAQTVGNVQSENSAKIKAWEEKQAQMELEQSWKDQGYSELPANGGVAKKIARNKAKEEARQKSVYKRNQSAGVAKSNFDNNLRIWGGNKEYSGVDLEAMLKNPNVSLDDSMNILRNKIHPHNKMVARQQKSNFQKAYAINYTDQDGNIRSTRTLTFEYSKLGEVIERGDKSFSASVSHMFSKVGVYSMLEGAIVGVSDAILKSVENMAQFDQQLAEVVSTTQNWQQQGTLKPFYSTVSGTASMQSQVQNDTFKNAETYGVSGLDTVMPIEQAVLARQQLTKGSNGKYDSNMKDDIVKKIMEFSAISTGGQETPEVTNELTQDALSLYQAYYKSGSNDHINKMNQTFDYLSAMKTSGVNTTAVTNAYAELAPDVLKNGVDGNQVMAMMGSYNLADASATGDDVQTIGRTFFNSVLHANTNDNLKNALRDYMGINLDATPMDSQTLINKVIGNYGKIKDNPDAQSALAMAFSGSGGSQGKAMMPKMIKFLEGTQGSDYQSFMKMSGDGSSQGAMAQSWLPFSETLKTNFMQLVEKLQEFSQLIGKLGITDSLGALVGVFGGILDKVNSLLKALQSLSNWFDDKHIFNLPKLTMELLGVSLALKGIQTLFNKKQWGGAVGDFLATRTGGLTSFGIKRNTPALASSTGTVMGDVQSAFMASPMVVSASSKVDPAYSSKAVKEADTIVHASEKSAQSVAKVMDTAVLKTSADSMLKDVLTFTTADMIASKLRNNPVMDSLESSISSSNIRSIPNESLATDYSSHKALLDAQIAKTAEQTAVKEKAGTTLKTVGTSVLDFANQALFFGMMGKGKGGATSLAEEGMMASELGGGGGILSKVVGGLGKFFGILNGIIPIFNTGFLTLITRVTMLSAVIFGIYELWQAKQKHDASVEAQDNKNTANNFQKIQGNSKFASATQSDVNKFIKLNAEPLGPKHDMMATKNLNDYMKKNWQVAYHGTGKNAYITYHDSKNKEKTAHVSNPKEMQQFRDMYNSSENAGRTPTEQLVDSWKMNTSYIGNYQDKLSQVNQLTKNLSENLKQVETTTKAIDANFAGISSASALKQKIDVTQKALDSSQGQVQIVKGMRNGLSDNLGRLQTDYNAQKQKALNAGVTQDEINNMETAVTVARNNNQPIGTVTGSWTTGDQYSKQHNTIHSALSNLAQGYFTKSNYEDAYNSTNDQYNQLTDTLNQYVESQKQLNAQMVLASTNIDALNASLSKLSTFSEASKAMVNISANPLQTGDNTAQISALQGSMQISQAQMGGMLNEKNNVQQQMNAITSANPSQDFSLNALYNPDQSGVTAQQLAYKTLYEQNNQITGSITSQSSAMYDQLNQMKDLVLNSTKYADSWQRIQDNVQMVKDSIKSTSDFQYQMATVDTNSLNRGAYAGQNPYDVKQQALQSLRDNSLDLADKLQTALASSGGDSTKLKQAWDEINKSQGSEFDKSFINPLKDIVSGPNNSFLDAGKTFTSGAQSFSTAVNSFVSGLSTASSSSSSSTNSSADTAKVIGGYSGSNSSESSYLASLGYKSGTSDYINAKQQFDSMGSAEQAQTISGAPASGPVVDAINKVFAGTDMHDYGAVYADFGAQYGVDPRLMASITMAETGGHSSALTNKNNVGGIMGGAGGGLRSFTSIDSSVEYLANLLSKNYLGQGLNTIPAIQSKYAPYNADNDPNHLNDNWRNNVSSYYSQMTGISQSQLLGGGSVNNAPAPSTSTGGGNGGASGMFGWLDSVLQNKSAMQYQWGGAHQAEDWSTFLSKAVADCSGLVEQVYKHFGNIDLGQTTANGLMHDNNGGTAVDRNNLQQGDMVFFGQGQTASHVGIYAGNNQMYTIDHDGMPVTKEAMWSDYIGGKHFNMANGAVGSGTGGLVAPNPPSAIETLTQAVNQIVSAIDATIASLNPTDTQNAISYKVNSDVAQIRANGNIADVMGTSGITGTYDRVVQARQDIFAKELGNNQQIDFLNQKRNGIIQEMQGAYNSGDAPSYNEFHLQLAKTDDLIRTLQGNTQALKNLDNAYANQQQLDPRLNYDTASQAIAGGINTLRLFNQRGQDFSVDYLRTVSEVNTMGGEYDTHARNTSALQQLFNTYGQQTNEYGSAKRVSDQDHINLVYTQLGNIGQVLDKFAQGTQAWYSALETVVSTEQALQQLEQTRLDNAKANFELTGTGSSAYIQQQAYMNSKDYNNAYKGYQDALSTYKSGKNGQLAYGISTGSFSNRDSAVSENNSIISKYGIGSNVVQNPDGSYRLVSDNSLTSGTVSQISQDVSTKTQGHGLWTSTWANNDFGFKSAHTVANDLQQKYGTGFDVINPTGKAIGIKSTNQNLSQDQLSEMEAYVKSKYGLISWSTGSGSASTQTGGGNHGIWTSTWSNNDFGFKSAHTVADEIKNKFGVDMNVINPTGKAIGLQSAQSNMSQELVNTIMSYIKSKFGLLASSTGSDTNTTMDLNQQMAGLQVIADAHNKMIDQMNQYKTAVTDGFKAGALSIDEYMSKLNQLRDKQTEAKDNAVNMIGGIQSGFQSALSDALTQGMQGNINSPIDFMNNIKSTISSSLSGQLASTLLNNTGLQDVMNKITGSITSASTSGDPNAIVNMFNNNDFGSQIKNALAPFLPMIQQIVGSTKGIFTILKDQVYNAPSGFKIDSYMNEIATKQTYQGLKTWNSSMVNDVGSPLLSGGSTSTIKTTTPSQTPTGISTGTSTPINGTTTKTGAPENTTGAGTGAPSTAGYTNGAINSTPFPSSPPKTAPAPAKASTPATSGTRSYTVQKGDNPWTIENKLKLSHGWLQSHNPNMNPNKLQIGQVLKYHTGGIAGIMNFQSAEGLKSNEVSAILQQAETVFQPRQLDDLVGSAFNAGANSNSGSGYNLTVNVNIDGGGNYDKQGIEDVVKVAVSQAMTEFKRQQRNGNLTWKGTSY